ncbi:MAG: YheC/YheD family protein [Cyanobacteria bacterium P01_F01_bin.42]
MKLLSICDPSRYQRPPLDVPAFYRCLSLDPQIDFSHIPVANVFGAAKTLPLVKVAPSTGDLPYDDFLKLGEKADGPERLSNVDLVFCRTLKPFPPGYLDQLSDWESWTSFVNRPSAKKEQMKPDFLLKIAKDFIPEALITSDWQAALAFFEAHQVIVAKQQNSCGGRGVYKIWYQDQVFHADNLLRGTQTFSSFSQLITALLEGTPEPLQLYRYLNRVDAGDKRVVVVDGELYGCYLRRSKSGHWVNNVSGDGECTLAEITSDEVEAIQQTVGKYQQLGLHTLGYDFLQDDDGIWRISEINAGNIGGFARLELLTGEPVMERLASWLCEFAQRPKTSTPRPNGV